MQVAVGTSAMPEDADMALEERELLSRSREKHDRRVIRTRISQTGLKMLRDLDDPAVRQRVGPDDTEHRHARGLGVDMREDHAAVCRLDRVPQPLPDVGDGRRVHRPLGAAPDLAELAPEPDQHGDVRRSRRTGLYGGS